MPRLIESPSVIPCVGTKPKQIEEYAGGATTGDTGVSVARMVSPSGWTEPGQRPEFQEITVVLRGSLGPEGAEYVAVCTPAFSPDTVHRDDG
jgi:hypothetical protein